MKQVEDAVTNTFEFEKGENFREHVEWMESRNYEPVNTECRGDQLYITFKKTFSMDNVV